MKVTSVLSKSFRTLTLSFVHHLDPLPSTARKSNEWLIDYDNDFTCSDHIDDAKDPTRKTFHSPVR